MISKLLVNGIRTGYVAGGIIIPIGCTSASVLSVHQGLINGTIQAPSVKVNKPVQNAEEINRGHGVPTMDRPMGQRLTFGYPAYGPGSRSLNW